MAISEQIVTSVSEMGIVVLLQLILLITGIAWFVNYRIKRRHFYSLLDKLPGPVGNPFVGHAIEFFMDDKEALVPKLRKWALEHNSLFKLWLGADALIGLSDPENCYKLLNSPYCLNKGYRFAVAGRAVIGDGLLFSDVHKWKPRRKLVASTFSPKILESFMPIFVRQSKILVEQLKKEDGGGEFDAWTYFSKVSLDSICGTAMGVESNSQIEDCSYLSAAQVMLEIIGIRVFKAWTYINFLFNISNYGRLFRKNYKIMQEFTEKVIITKKEQISHQESYNIQDIGYGKNPGGRAFLDYILEMTRHDETFTVKDIKDEVDTIMLTGFETTATTLCFCMLTLAFHQDCQQKVFEEIHGIFGDSDRQVEYEDLQHMQYLEQFIKETLRVYPTVFIFFRALTQDIETTCGQTIPAGCQLAFLLCSIHANPEIWPEPYKFDPDRFTQEECAKRHPGAFMPFAAGTRNCVGFKYAMISMKTIISNFLRHYQVFTDLKPETIRLAFDSTLKSKDGYKVKIRSRK